ncbi:hypothetical protein AMTRI_Chr08g205210 [Amborella trichopoda]
MGGERNMSTRLSPSSACSIFNNLPLILMSLVFLACFFFTDLINGIPPIIRHYIQNISSLRQIMVVVTVQTLPITAVLLEERFLMGKLGPKRVYRCLVQSWTVISMWQ